MSTMLFYDKIVPLNRDRHRELKLRTDIGRADFAGKTHYVPLAGTEFYQAARDYPVLFAGGAEDAGPVALLGLQHGQNLFLDTDGAWSPGSYVPAFVRRYPFILAKGDREEDYTVCFDQDYVGFSEAEGTALFDAEGKDSDYLRGMIDFLNGFLAEMERTRAFVERLRELDLLVTRELRVSDNRGRNFLLRDLRMVDEAKLAELDDAVLGELHRAGYLGWIYAHLVSIGNASRLPARLDPQPAEAPAEAEARMEQPQEDDKPAPRSRKRRGKTSTH